MLQAVHSAFLLLSLLPQGLQIPAPRGYVNDFAGVIDAEHAARIERVVGDVRAKSGGEIAVVTLPDLGGREVGDVALQIGRQWKVGAAAEVGDRTRNAGLVILVVPKETSTDGRGHISLMTGNGVEGFITDARAGDIRREATPLLRNRDYSGAIELMTVRVAQLYAKEFGFTLDNSSSPMTTRAPPSQRQPKGIPVQLFVIGFILLVSLLGSRRRGGNGCLWFLLGQAMSGGHRHHGGWGDGGFGGGGFGGGGFGGFGGGGGFSGGGSSGSW